ncbi:hypothetical protein GX51_02849 [Blastomyces parvus]|uniref:Uncharacterized protein n=1 Tax=Blastomyces parvus TaxID=2060905 RepID=A0A2B7X9W2_9EURO|nr:hypothetical protein GX51_02849 [Blastomyces parvus]
MQQHAAQPMCEPSMRASRPSHPPASAGMHNKRLSLTQSASTQAANATTSELLAIALNTQNGPKVCSNHAVSAVDIMVMKNNVHYCSSTSAHQLNYYEMASRQDHISAAYGVTKLLLDRHQARVWSRSLERVHCLGELH